MYLQVSIKLPGHKYNTDCADVIALQRAVQRGLVETLEEVLPMESIKRAQWDKQASSLTLDVELDDK